MAYDPCIWDILQAILDHISLNHNYEFSSIESSLIENVHLSTKSSSNTDCTTFDILLKALNEPDTHIVTSTNSSEEKQYP